MPRIFWYFFFVVWPFIFLAPLFWVLLPSYFSSKVPPMCFFLILSIRLNLLRLRFSRKTDFLFWSPSLNPGIAVASPPFFLFRLNPFAGRSHNPDLPLWTGCPFHPKASLPGFSKNLPFNLQLTPIPSFPLWLESFSLSRFPLLLFKPPSPKFQCFPSPYGFFISF